MMLRSRENIVLFIILKLQIEEASSSITQKTTTWSCKKIHHWRTSQKVAQLKKTHEKEVQKKLRISKSVPIFKSFAIP
jgi:hypothetical protein